MPTLSHTRGHSLPIGYFSKFAVIHRSSCIRQGSVLPRIVREGDTHVPRLHNRQIPRRATAQRWRKLGGIDVFGQSARVISSKNVKLSSGFRINPASVSRRKNKIGFRVRGFFAP